MKIHSRFRDYYDYVEFMYSPEGGDSHNTYNRIIPDMKEASFYTPYGLKLKLKGDIPSYPQPIPGSFKPKDKIQRPYYRINDWTYFPWRFKWCFVAGRIYLLVAESECATDYLGRGGYDWNLLNKYRLLTEDHPCLDYITTGREWKSKRPYFNNTEGRKCPTFEELSKMIGCPVFTILDYNNIERHHGTGKTSYHVIVSKTVPNLGQLGFPSIVSAEQMYQNISMYFNNLKDNPDNTPPASVSDKDRLTQKGFDAKLSFRGKTKV